MTMTLNTEKLKKLVRGILTTREDEIVCSECFERIDRFVEMHLSGLNAEEAMPLVQDHLNRCQACCEEFEALLEVMRADLNSPR